MADRRLPLAYVAGMHFVMWATALAGLIDGAL